MFYPHSFRVVGAKHVETEGREQDAAASVIADA
jgi:hypothetical protein